MEVVLIGEKKFELRIYRNHYSFTPLLFYDHMEIKSVSLKLIKICTRLTLKKNEDKRSLEYVFSNLGNPPASKTHSLTYKINFKKKVLNMLSSQTINNFIG
jgi:hypothetical protein